MKILFLNWGCFNKEDTIISLKKMGHNLALFVEDGYNDLSNDKFLTSITKEIEKEKPDAVFSYNYFPLVAEGCKQTNCPYISFMYDSPYTYIYSYTLMYPTNFVFLFDSSWVEEFRRGGLDNVFYMVLPGNIDKYKRLNRKNIDVSRTRCDISFVGALYNERHNFYERMEEKASPYLKGYLDGVIKSQMNLYGVSIVEAALNESVIKMMQEALYVEEDPNGVEPRGYRYANYFIKRKVTQLERLKILSLLGEKLGKTNDIKLFTLEDKVDIKGIKNMGISPYETEMPLVFNNSKINLNISLKSINTGIPLRCMDIMSQEGFLLSNYQQDLAVDFVPDEEFVFYEDADDLIFKAEYYLSHDKERKEIAKNAYEKIKKYYTFEDVFKRIFEVVFG